MICDFTHIVETYLSQGTRRPKTYSTSILDLLLIAIDCIRGMIECLQNSEEYETTQSDEVAKQFQALIDADGDPAPVAAAPAPRSSTSCNQ